MEKTESIPLFSGLTRHHTIAQLLIGFVIIRHIQPAYEFDARPFEITGGRLFKWSFVRTAPFTPTMSLNTDQYNTTQNTKEQIIESY